MQLPHEELLAWLAKTSHLSGARAMDAVMFETADLSTAYRCGKAEGIERAESTALGLRVFVGDGQAMVSSTDMSKQALGELCTRAVAMAKAAPPDTDSRLADAQMRPQVITDLDLCDSVEVSADWLREECRKAEEAALSVPGITNSEGADAHMSRNHISLIVDNGSDPVFSGHYKTSHFSVSISVLAGAGTQMERDYDYSSARHRSALLPAADIGLSAARRTLTRLSPRKISTCQSPILFDPRVGRQLLSQFAAAISGSSVTRGASFLKDAMEKTVFSPAVTIVDDPLMKRGLASRPFDGEAMACAPLNLVENGVLSHWLLDMRTATKLKLQSNGRAARGIGAPPSPSATNLYMRNGNASPNALMQQMQRGLLVTETFGAGVNLITGDYSQGAAGFWIEGGEIAYPVSEITIAGRLQDMFSTLIPANDLEFRYNVNAPTLLVERMTIAGA